MARVERDLKDLNLLSHIFTRTRKRDVFEKWPERSPRVVRPPMTEEENAFYWAVTNFVRDIHGDAWGGFSAFPAISAQRQVASCMQAARGTFVARALERTDSTEAWDLDDDLGDLDESDDKPLTWSDQVVRAAGRLGDIDSKFDTLVEELRRLEEVEPGRKVIIFAYFRGTIEYLSRRLRALGFGTVVIHGGVKSDPKRPDRDERGDALRRFRDDPSAQILVSSEVGSEGLDFQFCHILINYDLAVEPDAG